MTDINVLYLHTDSNSNSLNVDADEKGVHFVVTPSNDKPFVVTLTEKQASKFADSINHYLVTK